MNSSPGDKKSNLAGFLNEATLTISMFVFACPLFVLLFVRISNPYPDESKLIQSNVSFVEAQYVSRRRQPGYAKVMLRWPNGNVRAFGTRFWFRNELEKLNRDTPVTAYFARVNGSTPLVQLNKADGESVFSYDQFKEKFGGRFWYLFVPALIFALPLLVYTVYHIFALIGGAMTFMLKRIFDRQHNQAF